MDNRDAPAFERIICDLHVAMGYDEPPQAVVRMWWEALKDIPLAAVSRAAGEFFATRKGRPLPVHIRELTGRSVSAWPGPEEAWNMLPKDEWTSGWMNAEMAAGYAACADSLQQGNMIAARMAFIETYKKRIAGKEGSPEWWISEASAGSYESRLQQKADLLRQHPDRFPSLSKDTQKQLEVTTGSTRLGQNTVVQLAQAVQKRLQ